MKKAVPWGSGCQTIFHGPPGSSTGVRRRPPSGKGWGLRGMSLVSVPPLQ